jgi:hypothetical protein
MTTIPLNCDGFAEALADYLERDDSPRIRAAVEAHAESCTHCGALLGDLQQLRVDASGLPTLTPSRDLWGAVAERIEAPVLSLGVRGPGSEVRGKTVAPKRMPSWLRPAAAAAALVVLTAGVTYFATREALLSGSQLAVDSASLDARQIVAQAIDSAQRTDGIPLDHAAPRTTPREPRSANRAPAVFNRGPIVPAANQQSASEALEPVYGREIEQLRRIVDERRVLLDTATVGVIERNLTIIDQAIRESRAALARDPASAFLNEQLNKALEQKVELLRAAALLPVRS